MELNKQAIPATIQKVETMSRHIRIVVDTQEGLTGDTLAYLFGLHEKLGWFFFLEKPNVDIDTDELPEIQLEDGEKSRAQVLRGVMYRYWEQKHKNNPNSLYKDSSELFYKTQLDKYIDKWKEALL